MTADELKHALDELGLSAGEAARIFCLHSNKLSEYLGEVSRIPCSLAFTIEAVALIDEPARRSLFQRRLQRKPHSG